MGRFTIANIRVLNLLQNFRPYSCVAFLVLVDAFWAQVEPLADAAGSLVRRGHGYNLPMLPSFVEK
jgi:hypothetical protein